MRSRQNVTKLAMTITRPSWSRTLVMRTWDDKDNNRVFIRILKPPKEAGTSFLRLSYNLWHYLPKVEKIIKIPPTMLLQPWMGSDFTNDDLVKESSYIDDYDHSITGREQLDGQQVLKIELTPHPRAPVVWGKVLFWLREKDDLPVRQHFIDEKGKLVKDLQFSNFKTMDGRIFPTHWEMTPVLRQGHRTTIDIEEIDFDPRPSLPKQIFTKGNLRS